jgi:hypothetical protein
MNTLIQTSTKSAAKRPAREALPKFCLRFDSHRARAFLPAVSPAALLKEHKKVEIQQATIGQLKSDAAAGSDDHRA